MTARTVLTLSNGKGIDLLAPKAADFIAKYARVEVVE